jgi:hypothetical protein
VRDQAPKGTSLADARKRSTWAGTRRKIAKDRTRTPSIVKPKARTRPKPKPAPTPAPAPKVDLTPKPPISTPQLKPSSVKSIKQPSFDSFAVGSGSDQGVSNLIAWMGNQGFDVDETISILRKLKLEFYENEAWGGADYVASYLQHGKKGTEVLAKLTEEQIDWLLQNRTSEIAEDVIESAFFKKKNVQPSLKSTNGQTDIIPNQHGLDTLWTKDGDELLVGYTSMKEGETLSKFGIKLEKDGFMELSFTNTAEDMRALTGNPSKYNSTEFFIQAEKVGDISSSVRSRELMEEFVESLDSPPAFDIVIDVDGTSVINRQVFDIGFDDWIKRNHPDDAFDVWMVSSDRGNVTMKIFNQKSLIHRRTTNHEGKKILNNFQQIPERKKVRKIPENTSPRKESPFGMTTSEVEVDEFTEKVWGMIGDDGILSAEHAQRVGELVHEEIMKDSKFAEIETLIKEAKDQNKKAKLARYKKEALTDPKEMQRLNDVMERTDKIVEELQVDYQELYGTVAKRTLGRVRNVGRELSDDAMFGDISVQRSLKRSTPDLPADWVDMAERRIVYRVDVKDRGYFSNGNIKPRLPEGQVEGIHSNRSNYGGRAEINAELVVSKTKRPSQDHINKWLDVMKDDPMNLSMDRTSLHEFVHSVQQSSGRRMQQLEREFIIDSYRDFTKSRPGYKFHGDLDGWVRLDEVFEIDTDYLSKVYTVDDVGNKVDLRGLNADEALLKIEASAADNYEVMTMGTEGIFHGVYGITKDERVRNFVLGMLFGF